MRGRGSDHSNEFIREVDEAVRQDRWLKLWKQYGAYMVGAALAVLVGTAAGVGWRAWQDSQRKAEADRYMAASALLRDDHPAEAAEAFGALAQDSDTGYGVLAHLQAAHALGQAGDTAGKLDVLDRLAGDAAAGPLYRDLGELLAAQEQFADSAPDSLASQLEKLTAADSPWRYSALELQALTQLRAGDTQAARQTLSSLVDDPRTPPDMSRRAAELLASLGGPIGPGVAGSQVAPGAGPDKEAEATSQ